MKKFTCCLLTILILLNSLSVICYAADESFVIKAVEAVENKINIPENYTEFNSKLTVEPNGQFAYFTWYGEDDETNPGGQINVTVDDKLRIISFSQYLYGEFKGDYKLSEYSSDEAKAEVEVFLAKACPEFYLHTKLVEQEYSVHRNFEPYTFKFIRYENELPCYDNYIEATVDAGNGMVSSFEVNWVDYDKIYPSKTTLSPEEGSVLMFDNIGMVKEYAKKPDGNMYIRYADLSDGVNYINAYTGNMVNTNHVSTAGNYKNAITSQKNFDFWYAGNEFDIEYAISVVENNQYIPLGAYYTLTGIQYLADNYSSYLYMVYEDTSGNVKTYIVDVTYGDVRYYDCYQQNIGSVNHNYSLKHCEYIAENFVMNYVKSFGTNCKLLNYNNARNYNGEDIYYFNYSRFVNNISYDNNGVIVGVSRSTGEVVSVRSGWDDVISYSYSDSVSRGQAFEKYINTVGFELQYVTAVSMTQQNELRAVYAPNPLQEVYIDALTGEAIDKNGNSVNAGKPVYKDIYTDLSREQILTLYACNILDEGEWFYPNEDVLLCDYLLWMCRAIDCVDYNGIYDVADKLVNSGLVTYEELMLNKPVNTETGIKYIVTYLGYGDIAKLSDTFKTGFVDEVNISPEMVGYAAIAKGLKIFQGNAFMPKEYIKRNVAAQILYNLISN